MEFFCSNFSIPVIGISYRNLVTNKYRTSKEQRMIGLAIGIGTSRQPFGKKKKKGRANPLHQNKFYCSQRFRCKL